MRRTAGLVIAACALLTLGGVASAAPPRSAPAGTGPVRAADAIDAADSAGAGSAGAGSAGAGSAGADSAGAGSGSVGSGAGSARVNALRAAAAGAPEKVGSTEPVRQTLGGVSARRSMTLHYPGASYVKVHFSRLQLLPGDSLTVSGPEGAQRHTYTWGLRDQWAMSIDGDTAVVALHGKLARLTGFAVTVDKVAHGFTPAEVEVQKARDRASRSAAIIAMSAGTGTAADSGRAAGSRTESVCGSDESRDAVCYKSSNPVAYARSKAVARLLINGDELCSAWRVGPNNRMFTNHHCFTSTTDAQHTEVWFDYECAVCGGYATLAPTKVWADQVLATDATLDYTLFTVADFAAVADFGYLSLDVRDPQPGEELYIPQHPGGVPTVIAMASAQDQGGNCMVSDSSAAGYAADTDVSYLCDTAGGSSGSPVLSRGTNKVVALHHFGGCPNSGVRIDLIYNQLKSLL